MATFSAIFPPKSQAGGISDAQAGTLGASGGTANVSVGKRQLLMVSVAASVFIRFSIGNSNAASTDILIPGPNISTWDTGDEYDTINLTNNNGAATTAYSVTRLNRAG